MCFMCSWFTCSCNRFLRPKPWAAFNWENKHANRNECVVWWGLITILNLFQDYCCTTSVGSLTWTKPKVCENLWRYYIIQGIKIKADFTNRIFGHFSASLRALYRLVFIHIKLTTSSNGHTYYSINVQNITTNTTLCTTTVLLKD